MIDRSSSVHSQSLWGSIWLLAGPLGALITYILLPDQYLNAQGEISAFDPPARATLAMLVWMAVWWLTEATDIRVTALLPIVLFPLFGITSIKQAAAPYASDIIFLFLGGFIIAAAIQRWKLDRRVAITVLKNVGDSPSHIIGGLMLATAFLSAFISNTATTAMMLPIGLSVIALLLPSINKADNTATFQNHPFAACLMLCIAHAASIGGISTVIGTLPNSFFVSFAKNSIDSPHQEDISFLEWSQIGAPVAVILLIVCWWLFTKMIYKVDRVKLEHSPKRMEDDNLHLEPMSREEKIVLLIFGFTILLWLSRSYLQDIPLSINGNIIMPLAGMTDSGIAIFSSILLFLIPAGKLSGNDTKTFILEWKDTRDLPWGILFLLGGGLSLAAAVKTNNVTDFIGAQATMLSFMPPILILLIIIGGIVFLTELTSNTATTATLIPLLAAIAPSFDINPYNLIIPATIAASCAFMLPTATPPNAIVFGSGHVSIWQMRKSGFWLNLCCIAIITLLAYLLGDYVAEFISG